MAKMITYIYKIGPLTYSKIFQCDNGSEFKGEVTKMLEKHEDSSSNDEIQAYSHSICRSSKQNLSQRDYSRFKIPKS